LYNFPVHRPVLLKGTMPTPVGHLARILRRDDRKRHVVTIDYRAYRKIYNSIAVAGRPPEK
jgi:hypothetical protein